MLELRRLRLLSELARRDTIAQVAKTVGYTPSAVSQSLAKLERDAGVPLLERDGRRVRLTPAARSLVTRVDRVIAELDAAEAELAEEAGAVQGRVEIGSFPSAAMELVLPAIADLRERHSNLTCQVYEHEPEDGIPLLRAGELDLLVTEAYDNIRGAATGGLESQLLVSEPLLLVLPTSHPGREPIPLHRLREADWIGGLVGTQFAAALETACRSAGFTPRIEHRADEARLYQALAGAGLGVGMLGALACTPAPGVRYARPAKPAPRRLVSALLRGGSARRPALAATLDALRRQAGLTPHRSRDLRAR
jgi:DNA-binding transcriptional LysR family regulator